MTKRFTRAIVTYIIAVLACLIIRKYHPKVIMVTGSVGKTSTKDALAAALSTRYFLRKSEKSFNSEFGVPLTIIGARNPWMHPIAWLRVFRQALALILLPNHYPKMLVLEVGASHPGDLTHILHMVTPDAVVVTHLPDVPVHVESYATPQAVRDEEFAPAYLLSPAAPLIISADDPNACAMAARLPARVITYGAHEDAQVHFTQPTPLIEDGRVVGMQAQAHMQNRTETLKIYGSVGDHQIALAAAALATAAAFDVEVSDALAGLKSYVPPPGRMRLFAGIHESVIIDDSYNASPAAVEKALATVRTFPNVSRRIAVLGDMLELGRFSVEEHVHLGQDTAEAVDILIAVGIRSRGTAAAARDAGLSAEAVKICDTSSEAISILSDLVQKGDVVLVKGSQKMRMECIVEALLADKADTKKLTRQDSEWKKRL